MSNKLNWADVERHNARVFAGKMKFEPAPINTFDGKESELHRMIDEELRRRRLYFVHSRTDQKTTQQKGVPDYIIAMPPKENDPNYHSRTLWVEVKKRNGKLSAEQTITKHVLLALGHKFAVVYSFDEFLSVINQ